MLIIDEIQEIITGLIYLWVGVRLARLSRSTNESPELFLGLSFALWGSNYLLYNIPYRFFEGAALEAFSFVARLAIDLGVFLFTLFVWKVFRSDTRWGGWLVASVTALLLAGIGGSVWVKDWEGAMPISNPWFWPAWVANLIAYAWMLAEGFPQYRGSRRRQSLGLCSAIVCDRFGIWVTAGLIWFLLHWVLLYQYIEYDITGDFPALTGAFAAAMQIVPAVAMWLAFCPPTFYRAWVERRYALD
jgi:hypothetical protein